MNETMTANILGSLSPVILILIGWSFYWILSANHKRNFLPASANTLLFALSFAFNLIGAFVCFKAAFGL